MLDYIPYTPCRGQAARQLPVVVLFTLACGQDTTTLEVICGSEESAIAVGRETSVGLSASSVSTPMARSLPADPSNRTQATTKDVVADPLCLSPSSELLGTVRASVQRFAERLEIPVVIGERCVQVSVQETVLYQGKAVSGLARRGGILIAREMLTTKRYNLDRVVDHEIGHLLDSRIDRHVNEPNHIMSEGIARDIEWTQEDIDLWCKASPCGRTELNEDWTYPVPPPQTIADAGTSYLSDGVDAGGYDGGLTIDAGY